MKKERKDKDFIKAPYYPGGKAALEEFVKRELKYPKEALQAKIEGTVSVRYTVDYKGRVIDAHIVSPLGHGCDEEALRIVKELLFTVPEDGKIKSKYTRKLHIHFRLPGSAGKLSPTKKIPIPSPQGQPVFQYQITSKTIEPPKTSAKKSTSYTFQVNLTSKKNEVE